MAGAASRPAAARPSIRFATRHEARKKTKEEGAVADEDRVAQLYRPDQRWHAQGPSPPPPQVAKDEHRRAPCVQDRAIAGDDVRRTRAGLAQLRSHRGRCCALVGHGLEQPVPIFPPDPGGDLASGHSVAVPQDDVRARIVGRRHRLAGYRARGSIPMPGRPGIGPLIPRAVLLCSPRSADHGALEVRGRGSLGIRGVLTLRADPAGCFPTSAFSPGTSGDYMRW